MQVEELRKHEPGCRLYLAQTKADLLTQTKADLLSDPAESPTVKESQPLKAEPGVRASGVVLRSPPKQLLSPSVRLMA